MKRALLVRRHESLDVELLQRYRDLFVGGAEFKKRVAQYLIKNDMEPGEIYKRRCQSAHYLNYSGPIGGFFASWLFSKELVLSVGDDTQLPEEYAEFVKDADGKGQTLEQFLRARFVEALQTKASYWRVDFPRSVAAEELEQTSKLDYEQARMGDAVLTPIARESLINWDCDGEGWLWVMHYAAETRLLDPSHEAQTVTERWTCYYRDGNVKCWETRRLATDKVSDDDDIPEIAAPPNPTEQIPIVELSLSDDLWLMNHLDQPQLEHFRKRVALSWSIDRTCYSMPVFNVKNKRKPPTMGIGYYIMLAIDETVTFPSPGGESFQVVSDYINTLKDELHRVSTTMARGVDNNAAAIGRSGESKSADDSATETVLDAYGQAVKDPARKTMQLVSRARGEVVPWSASGMSNYKLPDAKATSEAATLLTTLQIPSATARKKIFMRAIDAMVPDLSEEERRTIAEELEEGVTPEDMIAERDMQRAAQQQALEPQPSKDETQVDA
jgi:hypothetical protein